VAPRLYGYVADFESGEALLEAARHAQEEGYRRVQAYAPFYIEGLAEATGMRRNWVPWLVLAGAIVGGTGGYFMLWYGSAVSYRLNVGGRPLNSWPAFIPITFELTVLAASLTGFFAVLLLSGLPRPYHPIFNARQFDELSRGRFFLCIEAADPQFEVRETWQFLTRLRPIEVSEVDY
jgi:hypothetical protein